MGILGNIVKKIELAEPKQLGALLDEMNRTAYQDNDWNSVSVKASYAELMVAIDEQWGQMKLLRDYGNTTSLVHDCSTGEEYNLDVIRAMANLKIAYEYFQSPPVVENPNVEGISIKEDAIDWNKPIYTYDDVKSLLQVSDNTLRKWVSGGWIAFTQMPGSDKKFIEKENLMSFLRNPKIFYPSTK